MRMVRLTFAAVLVLSTASPAADPKLKGTRKDRAPKIDLGLPDFGALPTGEKLQQATPSTDATQPRSASPGAEFTIVRVQHALLFIRAADGARPVAPLTAVPVRNRRSDKFTTVVRVKHPDRPGARIDVELVDPRGETLLSASGELAFRGPSDETEWSVDWDPATVLVLGECQVTVRIGGTPMGAYPIKFAEAPK
jgi:hypothetical protein